MIFCQDSPSKLSHPTILLGRYCFPWLVGEGTERGYTGELGLQTWGGQIPRSTPLLLRDVALHEEESYRASGPPPCSFAPQHYGMKLPV